MRFQTRRFAGALAVALTTAIVGCAPPSDNDDDDDDRDFLPGVFFGDSTTLVVVVSPVINEGSTTSVKAVRVTRQRDTPPEGAARALEESECGGSSAQSPSTSSTAPYAAAETA